MGRTGGKGCRLVGIRSRKKCSVHLGVSATAAILPMNMAFDVANLECGGKRSATPLFGRELNTERRRSFESTYFCSRNRGLLRTNWATGSGCVLIFRANLQLALR